MCMKLIYGWIKVAKILTFPHKLWWCDSLSLFYIYKGLWWCDCKEMLSILKKNNNKREKWLV